MEYVIQNDRLTVTLTDAGTQMLSVIANGKERLWQNEDGSWGKHAPILFPYCGRCTMKLGDQDYGQGFHGFGRDKTFTCVSKTESSVTFALREDEDTLQRYPFRFLLTMTYTLLENAVQITSTMENTDNKPLYYSCGSHESYALPVGAENYEILFPQEEDFVYHLVGEKGLLSGETKNNGKGTILDLADEQQLNDTIILKNIRSRSVIIREKTTKKPIAEVEFPGISNLLFWHPGSSHMICVEPWKTLQDFVDGREGDFSQKEGVSCLQPGEKEQITRTIRYL